MAHLPARLAAALSVALLAACGGGGSTPPPPPAKLELACSVSLSGPNPVLNVVGRARSTASAGAPITVTLQVSPTPVTFTLSAPNWIGAAEIRGTGLAPGDPVTGQATVDGTAASASCVGYAGLPVLTARADRVVTGADLGWSAVAGANLYRWSILDGPNGAVVDSGSVPAAGTTAHSNATLDPLKTYVVEVGGYALTGTETTYPTPLPVPRATFGRALFTAGSGGGDGTSAWQLFGPGDFVGQTLTVGFPSLAAGERLAVLVVNAGGTEGSYVTVGTSGTGSPSMAPVASAPWRAAMATGGDPAAAIDGAPGRGGAQGGEALVSALRDQTVARLRDGRLQRAAPPAKGPQAVMAAATMPATRSFCQGRFTNTGFTSLWRSATLAYETVHAAFYYTDEVAAGVNAAVAARTPVAPAGVAPFWGEIGASYEAKILPALNTYFGPESDVDGNGKVIFLFANLGTQGSSFPEGYFWPGDIALPQATSASCPGGQAGNQADMLYLMDPDHLKTYLYGAAADYNLALGDIVNGEYPQVMAHELQHDVNFNTRFPATGPGGVDEETWLNEGLSMLSETVAGYGLHGPSGRAAVRNYQGELDPVSSLPYYRAFSMTGWEGNPYGNYAGVQAYMQYLLDHASPAMTKALENQWLAGKANVEAATGVPWEIGFAKFTTAAVFSNEDQTDPHGGAGLITSTGNLLGTPALNFLGDAVSPDYVPWHRYTGFCTIGATRYDKQRLAYVNYVPVTTSASASLRKDGWTAFATGPGSGAAATLTVQSAAAARPYVAVVKYSGVLPTYTLPDPTCP